MPTACSRRWAARFSNWPFGDQAALDLILAKKTAQRSTALRTSVSILSSVFPEKLLLLGSGWRRRCRRRGRGGCERDFFSACGKPCQEREERGDVKLPFFVRRGQGHSLGLGEFHLIAPGVDFDAAAQRQSCDLVEAFRIESGSGGEKGDMPDALAARQAVPRCRSNQVLQVGRLQLQRFQEQSGVAQFIFVRGDF